MGAVEERQSLALGESFSAKEAETGIHGNCSLNTNPEGAMSIGTQLGTQAERDLGASLEQLSWVQEEGAPGWGSLSYWPFLLVCPVKSIQN